MKYIIASSNEEKLKVWRRSLTDMDNVRFRAGYGSDTEHGADAAIVAFYFAHDRYGGLAEIGRAQALRNNRNDGYPKVIVATPPFPPGGERIVEGRVLEDRMYYTFAACIMAIQSYNAVRRDESVELLFLHLEAAGLSPYPDQPAVKAFRRAVIAHDIA